MKKKKKRGLPPEVVIRRQRWLITFLLLANFSVVYFAWLQPSRGISLKHTFEAVKHVVLQVISTLQVR